MASSPQHTYRVEFRHINCRQEGKTGKSGRSSNDCLTTRNWTPPALDEIRSLESDCCASRTRGTNPSKDDVPAETRLLYSLLDKADTICRDLDSIGVQMCSAYIQWANGPPQTRHGDVTITHNDAISSGHLALMDCEDGDYIQIDYRNIYDDDDESDRRGKMYQALSKLSRKASTHKNR
ncbi:hypothetical protein F4777DRAFT_584938 [Nemania sp. FL0916]|nr:hypothetical protein F4777DRAFT_584938 [Nemania sp. FL0916]